MFQKPFKRIMAFLLIILITISVGCNSNNADVDATGKPAESTTPDVADTGMKELYVYFWERASADTAVRTYNLRYIGESHMNMKTFSDMDVLKEALSVELMSGEGPDVIIATQDLFDSLYKVMKSGVFCDLEPLIKQDESFDMSQYNQAVFESGVMDDKRYFIPLSYYTPIMWTLKSVLDEYGIEDNENWTWDKLVELLERGGQTGEGSSKYIPGPQHIYLNSLLFSSGIEYIDYEKRQARFDSPEFTKLLETYRKLCEYMLPEEIRKSGLFDYDMFKDNSGLAMVDRMGTTVIPETLWHYNTAVKYFFNTDMVLYTFPGNNPGDRPYAVTADIAAINNNSRHKVEAFNFIKILLEEETQLNVGNPIRGIPVNYEALENSLKKYKGEDGTADLHIFLGMSGNKVSGIKIPESLGKSARDITYGTTKCLLYDNTVMDFIEEGASKFVEGKVTAGQAAKEINSKVMLYLNE